MALRLFPATLCLRASALKSLFASVSSVLAARDVAIRSRALTKLNAKTLRQVEKAVVSGLPLNAIPFNQIRSGRGHESFLQEILGTRNFGHYLFRP